MTTFWILWIFNALMALVPIYFFFIGLGDGTVTSKNIGMWFILLLVIAAVLAGTFLLKNANHIGLAKGILIVAAIPGVIAVLYVLMAIILKPRWN